MRLSTLLVFLSWLLPVACVWAGPPRYLQLVNQANESIVSLQAGARGTRAPDDVALDGPLRGGGESQTVALHRDGCQYDLRFGFADGRVLRYEGVDLCRNGKVVVRPLPRGTSRREYVVAWNAATDMAAAPATEEDAAR